MSRLPYTTPQMAALRAAADEVRQLDALLTPLMAGWVQDGRRMDRTNLEERVAAQLASTAYACDAARAAVEPTNPS